MRYVLLFVLILSGCGTSQTATRLDVLCVGPDGQVFHSAGVGVEQADDITRDWGFDACDVTVNESANKMGKVKE